VRTENRFRPSHRPLLLVVSAAALVTLVLASLRGTGSHAAPGTASNAVAAADDVGGLPQPVKPAFVPGRATFLGPVRDLSRWAVVRRAVPVRTRASSKSRRLTVLQKQTPEGTTNIVLVLGRRADAGGGLWIRVRVPLLGRNTGWVPRGGLGGYGIVTTRLVVDLRSLEATLFQRGRPIFHAGVGVGKSSWPTPRGEFYVRNRLTDFASPIYGPIAFGTSARSAVLTDWPAGGYVGIHGTDRPDLLPGHVSHGCIRMRNEDIVRLSRLMPVGTPLTIR
jgi:L,D-transpeptidase catalytic domain